MATDRLDFYSDQGITPLLSTPLDFNWPFQSVTLILINDEASGSTNVIVYNFAGGSNVAGKLKAGESVVLDQNQYSRVTMFYQTGAPAYRLMVNGK